MHAANQRVSPHAGVLGVQVDYLWHSTTGAMCSKACSSAEVRLICVACLAQAGVRPPGGFRTVQLIGQLLDSYHALLQDVRVPSDTAITAHTQVAM